MKNRNWFIYYIILTIILLQNRYLVFAQSDAKTNWDKFNHESPDWYSSDEAKRVAENVLLFQNRNGGWEKNLNMHQNLTNDEIETLKKQQSENRETTIDNGASYSQVRYLSKVYEATGNETIKSGAIKGIDYLLAAQYENGGWPQFYPLRKGYYTHITFNDNAMINVMYLLKEISVGIAPFGFVDEIRRERAKKAIEKGLKVILKSQVIVNGEKTVWCAQHDEKTLAPAKARSYELPSLSGSESVGIVRYLMGIDNPDIEIQDAVKSAVRWYEKSKITGKKIIEKPDSSLPKGWDRLVVDDPGSGPLWGRFCEITTNKPMFVGRDGIVKYNLEEIEYERRTGYNYIGNWAEKLISVEYPAWVKKNIK
jgi:PelA/Pel-15E family pectate lyase